MRKSFLGAILTIGVLTAIACSSEEMSGTNTTPTTDGGTTGSDSSVVVDGGGGEDLCAIQAAYVKRCTPDSGKSAACEQARAAQCPASIALDGKLPHDIITKCNTATSSCDTKVLQACANMLAETTQPTAAQAAVRDHLCARCGGTAAEVAQCKVEFFYFAEAGGIGAGFPALLVNDTIAKKIDTECALAGTDGGGFDCQIDFAQCAGDVYNKAQLPDPKECN